MATPATNIDTIVPKEPPGPGTSDMPARRRAFRFIASTKAVVGIVIIGFFVLMAIIGPWIAPYSPDARSDQLVAPPSAAHLFGTDHIGRDIFSQVLVGARSVIYVGFLAGVVASILSVLIGVTAGYLGGTADDSLSTLSNVFLVIPALPLIIIVTSTLPNTSDFIIAMVIGFTSWAWGARILRAQTLSLRGRDYVEAARATGEPTWRIIGFEVMPNLTAIIASNFISTVVFAVLSEITLAFIGVSSSSAWNWGTILFWAQSQQALAQGAWWWFVPAGLAIAILGTGLSLLNFGIDEFVNPRLRGTGSRKIRTATGHVVRMRVGFTPVLGLTEPTQSSREGERA